jgi:hypothetical protein
VVVATLSERKQVASLSRMPKRADRDQRSWFELAVARLGVLMDLLQQYLRETHDAGRLPTEAEFEKFKAEPADSRSLHTLAHHARYRGAGGQPFSAPVQLESRPG